jgi:hypothetical protein
LWLAAHAFLLVLILGLKFLGVKTMLLLAMLGTAAWFATRQRRLPRTA